MDWRWAVVIYFVIGLIMGEGLLYYWKKEKKKINFFEYVICLFLGPSVIIPTVITMTIKEKIK